MKKKSAFLAVLFLVFLLTSCKNQTEPEKVPENGGENGLDFALDSQKNIPAGETNPTVEGESGTSSVEDSYAFTLNGANIFDLQESIEIDGIVFKGLEVETQKELKEGIAKDEVTYFYEQTDEDGRLENGYSYIFAEITIVNTTDEVQEVYLSCGDFAVIDDEKNIVDMTSELRYRGDYQSTDETQKDYNRCEFEPGEEKRIQLCYIAKDSLLGQEHLYYTINMDGMGYGGEDIKAFEVW